jgi:histidinol dehydrogenase
MARAGSSRAKMNHPPIFEFAAAKSALTRSFGEPSITPTMLERNTALFGQPLTPDQAVAQILKDIRLEGDVAVQRYAAKLDGLPQHGIEVPRQQWLAARDSLEPDLLHAIRHAVQRVRLFHQRQPVHGFLDHTPDGALGQLVRPIGRVGLYAPAGANPLASSVIHTAVVASVAGVPEIVLCSPPNKTGNVDPTTLVAALESGVTRVFALGGAVAIGAMAYGTASIPKTDKIGGPGNIYTVLAMRQVYGQVGIVSLPGPTETLVLADDSANPHHVAADLLAQAEHVDAEPVLIALSKSMLEQTLHAVEQQVATLPEPNRTWATQAWEQRGKLVLEPDLNHALELANHYAPEHLCLLIQDPWSVLGQIQNAGGVFIGEYSMEALGDYLAGPSHVMPTMGTARFSSAVNVRDFQKIISVVAVGKTTLQKTAKDAARLARAEGLEAHARAIESRGS